MKETKREKQFRHLIIVIAVFITAAAFLYRNTDSVIEEQSEMLALVLQQSQSSTENPLVYLYEKREQQHILSLYEIERNNQYRFRSIGAHILNQAPSQLALDSSGNGIWLHFNNSWTYLNNDWEKVDRKESFRVKESTYSVAFEYVQNDDIATITLIEQQMSLKVKDKPKEVITLSENDDLFLILYHNRVKIAPFDTK